MSWLFLLVAIVAEVAGTSFLKASDGFTKLWPSVAVVAAYAVSFVFLSLTLRAIPVGVAYAIWSGVGVALVTAVGWWIYGQRLDFAALIGIALIVSGVAVLNLLSESAPH